MSALREIIASFGVSFDDAALKKGNASISDTIGSLKTFAGALGGGLALGAIFGFVHGLTEEADALAKQSDAMGLSLAEMQEWNYAAMMQGVSAETLEGVLAKLGSGKFDKGLADLKITTKDATGEMRNSTDILEDVADSLASIENPAERNRKAVAVLGKSYVKMLPLLQDGAKGIKELREEFQALGGGFSDDFAKKSDEFGDNVDRLKILWKNLTIYVVGAVLPMMLSITKKIVALAKPMVAIIKNSELLKAGAIALAVKGLFVLSRVIGPLNLAMRSLFLNVLPLVLAFLLFEDALTFLSGGDSLIGRAMDSWFGKGSQDLVRKFFTDLDAQAKASMDPKAGFGANIVATGLLMGNVFAQGLKDGENFGRVIEGVWQGIVLAFNIMVLEISSVWGTLLAGMADAASNSEIGKILTKMGVLSADSKDDSKRKMELARAGAETSVGFGGNAGAEHDAWLASQRTKLAADHDRIAAMLDPRTHSDAAVKSRAEAAAQVNGTGTRFTEGGAPIHANTVINVNVAPGTSPEQVKAVGAAAATGQQKGLNLGAAKAAVSPGKG